MKKFLLAFCLLSLFIILSFFGLLKKHMQQPLPLQQAQFLTVKKGTSVGGLAKELVARGWLKNRFWLRAYARLYPNEVAIKAGTYKISANIHLQSLLTILAKGKEHQFQITFVEGSHFAQWLMQLKNQQPLKQTLTSLSVNEIAKRLGINQKNPEGWFYPETYAFTQGTVDLQLLRRAHLKMKNTLETLWAQRAKNLPYQSAYQALIMASIIEKETSYLPEQPLIASVFINRLAKNMRLQTDPTVIYGIGERYQGDITRAHLNEKTPYNTYKIKGLPPTPIAMPGLSALKAALNPAESNYYYFVSNGDGKHTFSKTLAEHNLAVRQYLKVQKNTTQ